MDKISNYHDYSLWSGGLVSGQHNTAESVFMVPGSVVALPADLPVLDLDIASMLPLSAAATAALGIPVKAIA